LARPIARRRFRGLPREGRIRGTSRSRDCRTRGVDEKPLSTYQHEIASYWFAEAVFVARRLADGSLASAGSIELGLGRELIDQLERRLAPLSPRRRGSMSWYPAEVSVIASVHGLSDGPVRDAILRQVVDV
jgi:hypothetical protein